MKSSLFILILLWNLNPFSVHSEDWRVPGECRQVLLGITDDWNSSWITLQTWTRNGTNSTTWMEDGSAWKARIGKNGLGWGRGIHPENLEGLDKQEGDGRSPCGVFRFGKIYGSATAFALNPAWPYHQVTARDLWVEDSQSPFYNTHVRLDRLPKTPWELKQQMRYNDPDHVLKIFIEHNAAPDVKAGAGSAIFIHLWRQDGNKPTVGCTSMSEKNLISLLSWLDPEKKPLFVVLPRPAYERYAKAWNLPEILDSQK